MLNRELGSGWLVFVQDDASAFFMKAGPALAWAPDRARPPGWSRRPAGRARERVGLVVEGFGGPHHLEVDGDVRLGVPVPGVGVAEPDGGAHTLALERALEGGEPVEGQLLFGLLLTRDTQLVEGGGELA